MTIVKYCRASLHAIGRGLDALLDIGTSIDALVFFLTLLAGVGLVGYVGSMWLLFLFDQGQYMVAVGLFIVFAALVLASLARIPAALILTLGGAVLCGVAFLMGYGNALLPG
jgi:hypothetical protein